MKTNIHPKLFETKVTCVCGNSFTTQSVVPEIHVEVCASCHPFFTGEMKYVDTLGRVEKFQKKQAVAKKQVERKVAEVAQKEERRRPDSLKDMFDLIKKQASS